MFSLASLILIVPIGGFFVVGTFCICRHKMSMTMLLRKKKSQSESEAEDPSKRVPAAAKKGSEREDQLEAASDPEAGIRLGETDSILMTEGSAPAPIRPKPKNAKCAC